MPFPGRSDARRPSARGLRVALCVCAVMFAASFADAQSLVYNPNIVSFVPSDDHNAIDANGQPVVTEYDLEISRAGTSQPIVVLNLGKPAPASDGVIYVDFMSRLTAPPLPGVTLEARVAAVGPAGRGESTPSNWFEFELPPGAPAPTPATTPPATTPPATTPPPAVPSPAAPSGNQLPVTLRITQPAAGSLLRLGAAVALAATVSGQVSGVDFYANGRPIGSATASPYRLTWTASRTGRYTLTAVSVDARGAQVTSSPIVVAVGRFGGSRPIPQAARVVGEAKRKDTREAVGAASDQPGTRHAPATAPAARTTGAVSADPASAAPPHAPGRIPVSMPVSERNLPPLVQVTEPSSGAALAPGTAMTITAMAVDNEGPVARVEFYANSGLVGVATTNPYSVKWTPAMDGTYTVTAVAVDSAGAKTTSEGIRVVVGGR